MKRLRCCGRFCFWRLPYGPWACGECDRTHAGDMPKNAEARFWEAVDAMTAQVERIRPTLPIVRSPSWLWYHLGVQPEDDQ